MQTPIFSGLSADTTFVTRGYDSRLLPPDTGYDGSFAISYDAASNSYNIASAPITGRFYHYSGFETDRFWIGLVQDPSTDPPTYVNEMDVFRTGAGNPDINLTYSSYAFIPTPGRTETIVAFGVPTPSAAVPTTGTATYLAKAYGDTASGLYYVRGDVQLNFDFGAGTLGGYFDPMLIDLGGGAILLPRYNFINTSLGSDRTTYAGSFGCSLCATRYSAFDGALTGPAGEELIGRFQAPYIVTPDMTQPETMFGIWLGKKQ